MREGDIIFAAAAESRPPREGMGGLWRARNRVVCSRRSCGCMRAGVWAGVRAGFVPPSSAFRPSNTDFPVVCPPYVRLMPRYSPSNFAYNAFICRFKPCFGLSREFIREYIKRAFTGYLRAFSGLYGLNAVFKAGFIPELYGIYTRFYTRFYIRFYIRLYTGN